MPTNSQLLRSLCCYVLHGVAYGLWVCVRHLPQSNIVEILFSFNWAAREVFILFLPAPRSIYSMCIHVYRTRKELWIGFLDGGAQGLFDDETVSYFYRDNSTQIFRLLYWVLEQYFWWCRWLTNVFLYPRPKEWKTKNDDFYEILVQRVVGGVCSFFSFWTFIRGCERMYIRMKSACTIDHDQKITFTYSRSFLRDLFPQKYSSLKWRCIVLIKEYVHFIRRTMRIAVTMLYSNNILTIRERCCQNFVYVYCRDQLRAACDYAW
jgi:hypothetical protein